MIEAINKAVIENGLVTAFAFVEIIVFLSGTISRRLENMALDHARDLVERLLEDRAKLARAEAEAFERENPNSRAARGESAETETAED